MSIFEKKDISYNSDYDAGYQQCVQSFEKIAEHQGEEMAKVAAQNTDYLRGHDEFIEGFNDALDELSR